MKHKAVTAIPEVKPANERWLRPQHSCYDFQRLIGRARREVGADQSEIRFIAIGRTPRLKPKCALETCGNRQDIRLGENNGMMSVGLLIWSYRRPLADFRDPKRYVGRLTVRRQHLAKCGRHREKFQFAVFAE